MTTGSHTGTAFDLISQALEPTSEWTDFRAGRTEVDVYTKAVVSGQVRPAVELNEDQLNLSTRFPVDEEAFVDRALSAMLAAGTIESIDYPKEAFAAFRRGVHATYDHGPHLTYIFPEEERLLFALAHICAPKVAMFAGSYYGYWAVWSYPAVAEAQGRCLLVDVDEDVLALAAHNARQLGFADVVETACVDATHREWDLQVDFCGLDAEGPKEHNDPDLADKAIYFPIMERLSPVLRPGSLLVAHNMLLDQVEPTPYFTRKIEANLRQYAKFHRHLEQFYGSHAVVASSEGVGVYRRNGQKSG